MKTKNIFLILLLGSILNGIISCQERPSNKGIEINNSPNIVNFSDKVAFNEFLKLNLDSTYANLLDPKNSTEPEYKAVIKSWSVFHQKISKFIKDENFQWEVPDSTISIVNRIYFDKNGAIDYYFFNILNSSIPTEKRFEYEKVLQKFSKSIRIELPRNEKYAQCGKTKYLNYKKPDANN